MGNKESTQYETETETECPCCKGSQAPQHCVPCKATEMVDVSEQMTAEQIMAALQTRHTEDDEPLEEAVSVEVV